MEASDRLLLWDITKQFSFVCDTVTAIATNAWIDLNKFLGLKISAKLVNSRILNVIEKNNYYVCRSIVSDWRFVWIWEKAQFKCVGICRGGSRID